jgi:hypothetical protein
MKGKQEEFQRKTKKQTNTLKKQKNTNDKTNSAKEHGNYTSSIRELYYRIYLPSSDPHEATSPSSISHSPQTRALADYNLICILIKLSDGFQVR